MTVTAILDKIETGRAAGWWTLYVSTPQGQRQGASNDAICAELRPGESITYMPKESGGKWYYNKVQRAGQPLAQPMQQPGTLPPQQQTQPGRYQPAQPDGNLDAKQRFISNVLAHAAQGGLPPQNWAACAEILEGIFLDRLVTVNRTQSYPHRSQDPLDDQIPM